MLQREHPPEEKRDLTAALWHQSHTRDDYGKKKALVAFRLFPDEAIAPLEQPQFPQLGLIGFNHVEDQELVERLQSGAEVTCEIVEQEISNSKGTRTVRGIAVEGTFLGTLTNESPSYPLGTSFKANVKVEPPATVTATLADGTDLKIKNVRQYAYRGREFTGNEAQLSLRPADGD